MNELFRWIHTGLGFQRSAWVKFLSNPLYIYCQAGRKACVGFPASPAQMPWLLGLLLSRGQWHNPLSCLHPSTAKPREPRRCFERGNLESPQWVYIQSHFPCASYRGRPRETRRIPAYFRSQKGILSVLTMPPFIAQGRIRRSADGLQKE